MQRHSKLRRACLLMTITGLGFPATGVVALADSVPESIRIQERAEKAYEAAPVVPIERGNAHHRDSSKEEEDQGQGGTYIPPPAEPPPAKEQHGSK